MNIEMDDNTAWTAIILAICLVVFGGLWMIYRYHKSFVEEGYTQVQMQNTTQSMWVKTNASSAGN